MFNSSPDKVRSDEWTNLFIQHRFNTGTIDYISFDFKTPSTGVRNNPKVLKMLCDQYSGKAQIKAVIADKKDFEATFDMLEQTLGNMDTRPDIPWVLTPCYEPDEEFPADRFSKIVRMHSCPKTIYIP